MTYDELCQIEDRAWKAFYSVFRERGHDEVTINKLKNTLDRKDCYNDVSDCLVEVFVHG